MDIVDSYLLFIVCYVFSVFALFYRRVALRVACENIRFSSLFVTEDVSCCSSARNVLSDEERGETDVFAGYP